jgi:hypothetical protein
MHHFSCTTAGSAHTTGIRFAGLLAIQKLSKGTGHRQNTGAGLTEKQERMRNTPLTTGGDKAIFYSLLSNYRSELHGAKIDY